MLSSLTRIRSVDPPNTGPIYSTRTPIVENRYRQVPVRFRQSPTKLYSALQPHFLVYNPHAEWIQNTERQPAKPRETQRTRSYYNQENQGQKKIVQGGQRSYYAYAQNRSDSSKLPSLTAMSIPSSHSSNSASSATNTTTPTSRANLNPKNQNQSANKQPTKPSKAFTMMPSVTSRLKKNISRTKEKILQGIGKTDRTADESFDLYVDNFEKQHTQAAKLTKELNRYLTSLRETERVSKNFYDTLRETYEPDWPDHQDFAAHTDLVEHKWSDYIQKLVNDVQMPLISYLNEFPELKKKIEKRDNRLLDFDNARHTLESVQHKTNKKNSGSGTLANNSAGISSVLAASSATSSSSTEQLTKLTKLKIDLEDKQHVYEEINQTLCMTLPVLFENRIKFYSSLFQTFFYTEATFHSDCVEVKTKLDTICEKLSTQTRQQISNSAELYYAKICQDQTKTNGLVRSPELPGFSCDAVEVPSKPAEPANQQEMCTLNERYMSGHLPASIDFIESTNSDTDTDRVYIDQVTVTNSVSVSSSKAEFLPETRQRDDLKSIDKESPSPPEYDPTKLESIESFLNKHLDSLANLELVINKKQSSGDAKKCNGPEVPGATSVASSSKPDSDQNDQIKLLYKVRAMYAYEAKELDELTFAKDDLLSVVEGTESENEDLDEGWCIGIHEVSLKRGLFPANFTKKI